MLFKFLLAPIALAASVVCYPPGYSSDSDPSPSNDYRPDYRNSPVDFVTCIDKIRQTREPIASSCQRQAVQDATSKLNGLYEPIHALSYKLHTAFRNDRKIPARYTYSLVSLFRSFQGIVDTIGRYPKVVSRSQEIIFELNSEFESILYEFSSAGVNIHKVFSQATKIRFESWRKLGFSFPEKFGFYNDN